MAQISINTSQNVLIVHPAASLGKRVLAQLLDFVILFTYLIAMAIILSYLDISGMAISLLLSLPVMLYSFLMELFFQGQSVGKMAANIRVVKLDGSQATVINYFTRWILRIIDIPFYGSVAIITIAINGKGQRLGDIAAGTTVINFKEKVSFSTNLYKKLPTDYQLQFSETEKLSEKDIKTVVEVLEHNKNRHNRMSIDMLIKTKEVIESKIGIKSNMSPLQFLQTIVSDYNFIVSEYSVNTI